MKKKSVKRFFSAVLSAAVIFTSLPASAMAAEEIAVEAAAEEDAVEEQAQAELIEVGVFASVATDYVATWENLEGIHDPDFEPTRSNQGNGQGWGNWPQDAGSSHYVEYTWDEAITTSEMQIFWYDDGGGTQIPATFTPQYKDESGAWKDITLITDYADAQKKDAYNTISIESVTTTCIRLNMTVRDDAAAMGIYRWKVFSELTDQTLNNVANSLEIPEARDNALSTKLNDSITLTTSMFGGLVTIDWTSDNEAIISADGKVTAPAENTKVTLTATLKTGSSTLTKDIVLMVLAEGSTTYSMTLDKESTGVNISQELFGLFYEDINSSADGGLSPELVKNNSFQNYADGSSATNPASYGDQTSWKKYWTSSSSSGFTVEQEDGLNENNTNYAKLTGNQTLSNVGYTRMWQNTTPSIPIEADVNYDFSMWMKADAAYAGEITVQVVSASNEALTDVKTLELKTDEKWNKISTTLTGNKKQTGKLVLTISGAAASDVLYVDMVSLASQDTYGYGNKNYAYGAGLRKDLVEKLADLNPSFIRFPGGCAIEGDYGPDSFYNWENSVGPLEERKAQASYWGDYSAGKNPDSEYGYMMSFELGYHEILTLCEDLGAEAFPIMSAGIYCQFIGNAPAAKKGEELDPYAQYAIDLLNYCWGNPLSSDPEEAEWAMKRVENGHEAPFELHYIGIGNENWNTSTINYYENFTYIKNKIDAYKAEHYPDHELQLIMAYGPYHWNISIDEDAYSYVKREMPGEVLMDEHYYAASDWMLSNSHRYDKYDRLDEKGTNVFVGEYATNDKGNKLEGAIAEAAYMTGFERNGDIVRHASYAPLLAKEDATNWSPNLIYFDEYDVMGTPNYYVQWMYANNYGKTIVNTDLSKVGNTGTYNGLSADQTEIYQVSSMNEEYIYLKLVNSDSYEKDITLSYPGVEDGAEVEIICLTGDKDAVNEIGNETVVPVTTKTTVKNGQVQYVIPAMSANVVKVNYAEDVPAPTPTVTPTATPTPTQKPGHKSHVGQTFVAGNLKYKVTKDDNAGREVRVTSMKTSTKTLKIPATVTNSQWKEKFKVTSVKAKAFKGKAITKAVIGKNVTRIGPNAFKGCAKLKSVTIGKNVKRIGLRAFYGCAKLKKVTIKGTALKTVKKNAFKKISGKAVIKVPKSKKKAYKKLLRGKIAKGVAIK